jgi:hypothetical protein
VASFCCFDGGRESTHATADHQNTLSYCLCHANPPNLNEKYREHHPCEDGNSKIQKCTVTGATLPLCKSLHRTPA